MIERPADAKDEDRMEVVIVRVIDGAQLIERPTHKPYYTWEDEFWWTEGNMGCDCNRGLSWARAVGETETDDDCGHQKFSVILRAPL